MNLVKGHRLVAGLQQSLSMCLLSVCSLQLLILSHILSSCRLIPWISGSHHHAHLHNETSWVGLFPHCWNVIREDGVTNPLVCLSGSLYLHPWEMSPAHRGWTYSLVELLVSTAIADWSMNKPLTHPDTTILFPGSCNWNRALDLSILMAELRRSLMFWCWGAPSIALPHFSLGFCWDTPMSFPRNSIFSHLLTISTFHAKESQLGLPKTITMSSSSNSCYLISDDPSLQLSTYSFISFFDSLENSPPLQ